MAYAYWQNDINVEHKIWVETDKYTHNNLKAVKEKTSRGKLQRFSL